MQVACLLCGDVNDVFHIFRRKALFNKPVRAPVPEAMADMGVAYCSRCRHISSHLQTAMAPEALRVKIYGEMYGGFVPTGLSPLQKAYTDFVAEWILKRLSPASAVLEIGCHDGYLLDQITRAGHRCEGVEPSPFADVARQNYGLPIIKEFFCDGQFARHHFDLVILRHVIEHVGDPVRFVRDAARVVKPGGHMYVEVPNSFWSVETAFYPEFHVDHVSYFTMPSLLKLLRDCGFGEVVHAEIVPAFMRFPFINVLVRKAVDTRMTDVPENAWFIDFRIREVLARFPRRYQVYLRNLRALPRDRTLVVWGAGSIGIQYAIDAGWSQDEVLYVDANPANVGLVLSVTGHPVHAPNVIREQKTPTVLVASGWEEDVRSQLGPHITPETQVLGFDDLRNGRREQTAAWN